MKEAPTLTTLESLTETAIAEMAENSNVHSGGFEDTPENRAETLVPYLVQKLQALVPHQPNITPGVDENFLETAHNVLAGKGVSPETADEIAKMLLSNR